MRTRRQDRSRQALSCLQDEQGAALVVTLLLLLGLAAMAASAVMISSTDFVVAGNERQYQRSLDVAEAGVAEAIHRLSLRPGTMVNVGGANIDASILDPADPPDPAWTTRIFLTTPGAAPVSAGSDFNTGTVQTPGDYLEYSHATDPNQAITIQHKLRDFDGDGTDEVVLYDSSRIPPENPVTGQPVERITVRGTDGSSVRMVQVDAIRFPLSVNVVSAMASNEDVDVRGNVTVCGHNHTMATPAGTQLPGCSPAWDAPDGNLPAVYTTGDAVLTQGSTDLLGTPSATDTDPANTFMTLAQTLGISQEELNLVLENPDHTGNTGANQGITYVQGDITMNGGNGEGLLYVTGDLDIAGGFTWRGLVYVEGDLKNNGTSWILGALMVQGDTSTGVDFSAGNPTVLYSRDTLQDVLARSMRFVVHSWKEI